MADRCYFVSPIRAPSPRKGWMLANDQTSICEFFSESAALACARNLAMLDCAAGHAASVYEVMALGRIVLKWRCHRGHPEMIGLPPDPASETGPAALEPTAPGASKRGGKASGSGGDSSQGGTTAQKKAAGRKGGRATARKR